MGKAYRRSHCSIGPLQGAIGAAHAGPPPEGRMLPARYTRVPADYKARPKTPATPRDDNPLSPQNLAKMYREAVARLEAGREQGLREAANESARFEQANSDKRAHCPKFVNYTPY